MHELRADNARRWRVALINGPNMSELGKRNPDVFGAISSMEDLEAAVDRFAEQLGVEIVHKTSNFEGEILEFIHASGPEVDAFMINPAGLTMFGMATRDALLESGRPYLEVHFANLPQWFNDVSPGRQAESIFSFGATGIIEGLRHHGYIGGLLALVLALDDETFLGATARDTNVIESTA
jgi:3-dehydroquinate dehydratase-2